MTPAALKSYSHKDLAQMAKQGGVRGWHSMRKDQLVKALAGASKPKPPSSSSTAAKKTAAPARRSAPAKANGHATVRKATSGPGPTAHRLKSRPSSQRSKNLASDHGKSKNGQLKERIVVMVRDAFWLHAYWEVKRQSVERVQAAMSQDWHTARPYLRAAGSLRRRLDQRLGMRDSRHRSSRRREQLVRPRRQLAQQLPPGTRLHGQHRPVLSRWSGAMLSTLPSPARAMRSTKTGPTWPRISTRSTP